MNARQFPIEVVDTLFDLSDPRICQPSFPATDAASFRRSSTSARTVRSAASNYKFRAFAISSSPASWFASSTASSLLASRPCRT